MALQEELITKSNGLATFADRLSQVPEGSLSVASNIVIDKDGLFSPRRGYENLSGSLTGAIKSLHTYTEDRFNNLLAYVEDSGNKELWLYDDDLGSWAAFATQIQPPSGANRIRTAQANKNLYLTSNKGVQKIDSTSSDIIDAGAPQALSAEFSVANDGTGTAVSDQAYDQLMAYRLVWGYKDAKDNLVLGPPSQRMLAEVPLATGVCDVEMEILIPTPPVDTNWFVQAYRTTIIDSTLSGSDPGDDMGLVLERNPNAARTTLNANITDSDTSLVLVDSEYAFPADGGRIIIGTEEIDYASRTGTTLNSLTRGVNGTTAAAHTAGDDIAPDDIYNKVIILQDSTPDDLRGADLYTNATQQGALQANYEPPQCNDLALYQNHMFYANTESKYSLSVDLLAVDFTGGTQSALEDGDTITINGVTYTGASTEDASSDQFLISNTADYLVDLDLTARSIVNVVNKSASNTDIWAFYDSGEEDLPGKLRFVERDYGDAVAFTMSSSRPNAWSPDIGSSTSTATNEARPNRIYYSKFQQPEAVPLLNYFDVGAANDEILRILPLRSILLIFTTAGIYKLTGATSSSFQVSLLDDTAKLIAPDTLVALNNTAVGLFDQGVSQVSYSSVQILSRPIEGDLNALRGAAGDKISELGFGISYETDRKYMIALPETSAATAPQIIYVYNVFTQSWTTYDLSPTFGIVRPEDDKIYLSYTDQVTRERKSFDDTDYADPEITVTVNSVADNVLTLTSVNDIAVGYQYYESSSKFSYITAVDTSNNTITLLDDLVWTTGSREVRPYIVTTMEWNPIYANSPNILKQFPEATLLVNKPITDITVGYKTLSSAFYEYVTITDSSNGPWGLFEWGEVPWGGSPSIFRYRTWVPRAKQRDSAIILRLTQNTIYNDFEISGWSLIYRTVSQRVTR